MPVIVVKPKDDRHMHWHPGIAASVLSTAQHAEVLHFRRSATKSEQTAPRPQFRFVMQPVHYAGQHRLILSRMLMFAGMALLKARIRRCTGSRSTSVGRGWWYLE